MFENPLESHIRGMIRQFIPKFELVSCLTSDKPRSVRRLYQFLYQGHLSSTYNKVIRPKSRASALSKKVRQTDRQTVCFFFKKTFETAIYCSKLLLHYLETFKSDKKPLKQLCDGRTDGRTDRKVAYRVAQHATKNYKHNFYPLTLGICVVFVSKRSARI